MLTEFWAVFIIVTLGLCVAGLLLYLLILRASLFETAREMDDKLKADTNTLVSVSTGDRAMRALAVKINRQLQSLRKEAPEAAARRHGTEKCRHKHLSRPAYPAYGNFRIS